MGIIYQARDLANDRKVAIKLVNLDKANALTFSQFLHEAEISARLHHPHIVTVYETGTTEIAEGKSVPFIAMELVHGTSLDQMHSLTYARILQIAIQVCEALEYAHDQGLVYRDLKPGNILLEKHGFDFEVKLTDFGLARPRGQDLEENESTRAGTLFYLAPELIAGQAADIRSDLYALGATLYEMITGRVPFSDFDEQTILAQHLESPVPPPGDSRGGVPPGLETIVMRLLAKQPARRFSSAREVRQALEQVLLEQRNKAVRGNLPPAADFKGQEEDLIQVRQLLEITSLVTILGGDRKTAKAAASQLAGQFSDGVWWVDLESVSAPAGVLEKVVSTLAVQADPQRPLTVSLVEYLREKNLLLLLGPCDCFEGACAQLIEIILQTCPDVRILATGHQPLGLPQEKCYRPLG